MQLKNIQLIRDKNRGVVLVLSVITLVVLLFVGMGLMRLGFNARLEAIKIVNDIKARGAADAGMMLAVTTMKELLLTKSIDSDNLPYLSNTNIAGTDSTASYSYNVTDTSDGYVISSTGTCGTVTRTVNSLLGIRSYFFGIGVKESIDVKAGATFRVDSEDGKLVLRTDSIEANAVTLKAGVVIPGDVVVGPGGDPDYVVDTKKDTVIEGDIYAAEDKMDFPPVSLPAVFNMIPKQAFKYVQNRPLNGIKINGKTYVRLNKLDIPNKKQLELKEDYVVYVEGKTTLRNKAELKIKSGGSLELYLGGDMEAKNSVGIINDTINTKALKIYGLDSCSSIDLKAKGNVFLGSVYAPNADLRAFSSNELAGAFIGNNFEMKNSADFTFMPELFANPDKDDNGVYFAVERWWEN